MLTCSVTDDSEEWSGDDDEPPSGSPSTLAVLWVNAQLCSIFGVYCLFLLRTRVKVIDLLLTVFLALFFPAEVIPGHSPCQMWVRHNNLGSTIPQSALVKNKFGKIFNYLLETYIKQSIMNHLVNYSLKSHLSVHYKKKMGHLCLSCWFPQFVILMWVNRYSKKKYYRLDILQQLFQRNTGRLMWGCNTTASVWAPSV